MPQTQNISHGAALRRMRNEFYATSLYNATGAVINNSVCLKPERGFPRPNTLHTRLIQTCDDPASANETLSLLLHREGN